MPISLSNLKNDKRTVSGEYFGDTFQVTYKPSEYTLDVEASLQNPGKDEEGNDQSSNDILIDTLCKMVTAWDVLGETGEPLPIDPVVLRRLPVSLLSHMMQTMREDMTPKAKSVRR